MGGGDIMKEVRRGRMSEQERAEIIDLVKVAEQLNGQKLLLVKNAADVLLIQQKMEQQARKEVV